MSDLELRWMTEKLLQGENRNLTEDELQQIQLWQERRKQGEPLAYILEERGFYKDIFSVGPGVLIPRPETEFIVEAALQLFSKEGPEQFAEFGFGSGCIGLSLLKEWPKAQLTAIEKSAEALPWAKKNIQELHLENRVDLQHKDVLSFNSGPKFSLVVSNPPYIAQGDENVEKDVHQHEPHAALYSGMTGLECLSSWSKKAYEVLADKGYLIFEFGSGQTTDVCRIIEAEKFRLHKVIKDYAGHDRVIVAQKVLEHSNG